MALHLISCALVATRSRTWRTGLPKLKAQKKSKPAHPYDAWCRSAPMRLTSGAALLGVRAPHVPERSWRCVRSSTATASGRCRLVLDGKLVLVEPRRTARSRAGATRRQRCAADLAPRPVPPKCRETLRRELSTSSSVGRPAHIPFRLRTLPSLVDQPRDCRVSPRPEADRAVLSERTGSSVYVVPQR